MTPDSTSERTSVTTSLRYLSSICSSSTTSAWTTLTPASIIVASWREKTCSDFGFTFLNALPIPCSPAAARSLRAFGRRPRDWSCSRAVPTSGALIVPESSRPWALIAL